MQRQMSRTTGASGRRAKREEVYERAERCSSRETTRTGEGRHHPYSLQEFGALSPVPMPPPLVALKAHLDLQDLQWSRLRARADALNRAFWEPMARRFEQQELALKLPPHPPPLNNERLLDDLDLFYARWLIHHRQAFHNYNLAWWRLQPALLKADCLALIRHWKWKLACWRYSFHS